MGEYSHRDLPNVRAEVFEGDDMAVCLIRAANWVVVNSQIDVIGYILSTVEDRPSVTVVYEYLRRLDHEVSLIADMAISTAK